MLEETPQPIPEREEPRSGLYYVIPSFIFECPDLEDSEKMFYGLLSGLANNKGYCFASDTHLAGKMRVSDRCIRDWTKKLESLGFIQKVTEKRGMYWDRKIYINSWNSKKDYERNPSSVRSGTPVPDRKEPQFRIVSEEEEYNSSSSACAGAREADASASRADPFAMFRSPRVDEIIKTLDEESKRLNIPRKKDELENLASLIDSRVRFAVKKEDICEAIRWAFRDDFWASRVVSNKTLETSFSKIYSQYEAKRKRIKNGVNRSEAQSLIFQLNQKVKKEIDEARIGAMKKALRKLKLEKDHIVNLETGNFVEYEQTEEEFRKKIVKLIDEAGISIEIH